MYLSSIINRFKKARLPFGVACIVLATVGLLACTNLGSKPSVLKPMPTTAASNLHVLELFTSEGCSSCPAADRLLGKLKAEGDSNIFILSYHVDYWDYLGWKDPFSQAAFSNRQRQYAQRFSLESIYTPQVVVNGAEEFVGSDESKLRSSLAKNAMGSIAITATAEITDKNNVRVSYSLPSPAGFFINVALVQTEAKTEVKRGENGGRTLEHVNVVRELKTVDAQSTGTVDIRLPDEAKANSFSLIVFVQQKSGGKITGATQVAVPIGKGAYLF